MNLKILTIQKSNEFKKISKENKKFHAKTILLLSTTTPLFYSYNQEQGKNAKEFCRVGYTVSKTVGNAVIRNLAKRRLREAVRNLFPQYAKTQFDYVVIAKREIAEADFKKILADLKFCLKRIH
ncbi:MAG: ribonuclease P protein component [Pelagibacterales bacterium]|nr:ribonuclease P protein component [Pelagibacterales bacterium]